MGRMLDLLKSRDEARSVLADTKDPPRPAPSEVVDGMVAPSR